MAIVHLTYCNASLGKQISFDFDNSSKAITNVVVGSNCAAPQPTTIWDDFGPYSLAYQGSVYPQNVAPYASYSGITTECALALASAPVINATNNISTDGAVTINVTGKSFYTGYSIDGGATFIFDNVSPTAHIFSGLVQGVYHVVVKTVSGGGFFGGSVECIISFDITIGYDGVICDLGIGTVITESANGVSDGKIKVLNLTGFAAVVEYRIDAGAWQDSAEFTGLPADTYNLQVRYKNFTGCVANRNVTIADSNSCDITIDGVQVLHEQTKYGDDGALVINITSSNPAPYSYSIDDGDNYQSSNTFVNLSPGTYNVKVIDSGGCTDSRTVELKKYRLATVLFPRENSYRVVNQIGPFARLSNRQNFDNTLFEDMRFAGVSGQCYHEPVELSDAPTYQFRSNYESNIVRLYKSNGDLATTLTPVKKTLNLDKTETMVALFADAGANKTQVFFENGVPLFFEIGQDITITDTIALDGIYEIKDIVQGIGSAEGYQVLIIDKIYSGAAVQSGSVTLTYDLEPYEIYEFIIIWSSFAVGEYYFIVDGADPQFLSYQARSEPLQLSESWPDHVQLKYKCYDNTSQMQYDTGIEHLLRVKGELRWPTNPGERVVYTDSRDRIQKLKSNVRRLLELAVYDLPYYRLEKIALALDSDFAEVDGVEYQSEENFELEYFQNDAFGNGKIKIREVEFEADNGDDQGIPLGIDILGTEDTLLGVP